MLLQCADLHLQNLRTAWEGKRPECGPGAGSPMSDMRWTVALLPASVASKAHESWASKVQPGDVMLHKVSEGLLRYLAARLLPTGRVTLLEKSKDIV